MIPPPTELEPGGASAEAVRRAAEALNGGGLVALPTEVGYAVAASAVHPGAVAALRGISQVRADSPALAVADPAEVRDWVPGVSALGERLARRCWPGPVTLAFREGIGEGLAGRLPPEVLEAARPGGTLGFWLPAHEATLAVIRRVRFPLLLAEIAPAEGAETVSLADELRERLAFAIDEGPLAAPGPTTRVRVEGNAWSVERPGVVAAEDVHRAAACVVVFVCTGNTCRSPMAEAVCKKMLADRLGCPVEELPARGFWVLSAGVSAMRGDFAAPEAVATAQELGGDLSQHRSRAVSADLLELADYVVAMTGGHLRALHDRFPGLVRGARLLCGEEGDLADPIGGGPEVYRACAGTIVRHLERFVAELRPRSGEDE